MSKSIDEPDFEFLDDLEGSLNQTVTTALRHMIKLAQDGSAGSVTNIGLLQVFLEDLLPQTNDPEVRRLLGELGRALSTRKPDRIRT